MEKKKEREIIKGAYDKRGDWWFESEIKEFTTGFIGTMFDKNYQIEEIDISYDKKPSGYGTSRVYDHTNTISPIPFNKTKKIQWWSHKNNKQEYINTFDFELKKWRWYSHEEYILTFLVNK